jgi:TonB-linked SusC/RagA family outer membrane protein
MGFFPAGSLGWIVSKEDFLSGSSLIDYLKIRGSYGVVGNADIGGQRFMYDQYWVSAGSYYFGTSNSSFSTTVQGTLANPDVTWEKEKKLNVGLEATLVDKIDLSLDVFSHNRYDILARPNQDVPDYLGLSKPDLNVGEVSNKGFEAMVRYNNGTTGDLQYYVQADLWYARNKIEYNSEALQVYDYQYRTGQRINQPFLLENIGFFSGQEDIDGNPRQIFTMVQPGDLKYKDQNGDDVIDQNDLFPIGYTDLPEITAGVHAGLKYKGFDLDIFFQGVTNRSVYWEGSYFWAFQNNAKISSIALGRWTQETASTATYPRLSASNNLNNFQPSSFWQRDGSYIKLRSLELGYTLPASMTDKVSISHARIFVNGTNLFSLDHMEGLTDPEILTGYPAVRIMTAGVRLEL